MITWLEPPYKGTNVATGFEVLVHGFILTESPQGTPSLWALCVNEDGILALAPHGSIALDWRYTRGKGWDMLKDVETES